MLRRWSTTSKLLALLAVVSGAVAFATVRGYQLRLERLRPALGAPVAVVVAVRDIARGTAIDAASLGVVEIPARFAQPGAFSSIDEVTGRTAISNLAAGEAVTRTRLAAPGAGPVAALVPPGLRAFPLAVTVPEGAVAAGDAVDVLATFAGRRPYTQTVVSGVEVLDAPDAAGAGTLADGGAPTASLVVLVTPEDAERLAYAAAFASLAVAVAPVPAMAA